MLLPDLPQEIIYQLTEFLSLEDKKACSLVCKSWKDIFKDSLHSDLVVHKKLLEDIVNPPQDDQLPGLKSRLLVRSLEIGYYTYATDEQLHLLQKTFPYITNLHIGRDSIISDNFGVTADWNIWKSLTELYITVDQTPAEIKNRFMKMILCLPLLRRLQIITSDKENIQASFSLDDFEAIHSNLNHLGYLELCTNLLTLSEKDIERMTNVSPATKMRSLDIYSKNADHRWLCYFARKYPNLRTLNFKASNIQPEIDEERSYTTTLFKQVPLLFQHLTNLNFRYCDLVGNGYLLFWDILHFHDIPLKNLSIDVDVACIITSSIDPPDIPKHITEVCLPRFSKTIESLYLHCQHLYTAQGNFDDTWDPSFNLVEVHISTFPSFEIDTLLCTAPHLKTIELHNIDIKVKGELYNSNRFGPKSFKVQDSNITSDVLRFLSFHCRSLNELSLMNTVVHGHLTAPERQFIDMSYTRLDKLYIEETLFIIQDIKFRKENPAAIIRPVDDIPPKQDYDPNALPVAVSPPGKIHYESFFSDYYSYMLHTSSSEHYHDEDFFSNYEGTEIITENTTVNTKTKEEEDNSRRWKPLYNHTIIKLGYVSDFEMEYNYCKGVF